MVRMQSASHLSRIKQTLRNYWQTRCWLARSRCVSRNNECVHTGKMKAIKESAVQLRCSADWNTFNQLLNHDYFALFSREDLNWEEIACFL